MFSAERSRSPSPERRPTKIERRAPPPAPSVPLSTTASSSSTLASDTIASKVLALAQQRQDEAELKRKFNVPVADPASLKRPRPVKNIEERVRDEERAKLEKALSKAARTAPLGEPPLKRARKESSDVLDASSRYVKVSTIPPTRTNTSKGTGSGGRKAPAVQDIDAELEALERRRAQLLREKQGVQKSAGNSLSKGNGAGNDRAMGPAVARPQKLPRPMSSPTPSTTAKTGEFASKKLPQSQLQQRSARAQSSSNGSAAQKAGMRAGGVTKPAAMRTQRSDLSPGVDKARNKAAVPLPRTNRAEREEEEESDFIDHEDYGEGDEAIYANNYSDFIRALGFSRGPTSVKTYRDLGGRMDRTEEAALRSLEREWEHADKRGTGSFLDVTKEEARAHLAARKVDAEERAREKDEERRKQQRREKHK